MAVGGGHRVRTTRKLLEQFCWKVKGQHHTAEGQTKRAIWEPNEIPFQSPELLNAPALGHHPLERTIGETALGSKLDL